MNRTIAASATAASGELDRSETITTIPGVPPTTALTNTVTSPCAARTVTAQSCAARTATRHLPHEVSQQRHDGHEEFSAEFRNAALPGANRYEWREQRHQCAGEGW